MELPSSETSQANLTGLTLHPLTTRLTPKLGSVELTPLLLIDACRTVTTGVISRAKSHENLTERQINTNKYCNCQASKTTPNPGHGSPFSGDRSCLDCCSLILHVLPAIQGVDHLTKSVQPIQLPGRLSHFPEFGDYSTSI